MIRKQNKALHVFHIILGLFFSVVGIILIAQADVIRGVWLVLLGLLFLLDFLQRSILKLPQKAVSIITVVLAILIIVLGVYVLGYQ